MAGRRHYTKVVMPLQPPVIDGRVSQVVKGEVLYPRPRAGRFKSRLYGSYSPPGIILLRHQLVSLAVSPMTAGAPRQIV